MNERVIQAIGASLRQTPARWEPRTLTGWGRLTRARVLACMPRNLKEAQAALADSGEAGLVVHASGCSYGDVALNSGGRAILTAALNDIQSFDPASGRLVCGPGVTIRQLLDAYLPQGFLPPVAPGTAFVSIGGAVANDVHGKNHDTAGSFGDHVEWIDLLLPSGELVRASPQHRTDLYDATIGGVGLTGILWRVCLRLQKVPSNAILTRETRAPDLDRLFASLEEARTRATYSVGWVDVLARGANRGRGLVLTGEPAMINVTPRAARRLRVAFDFPSFALNGASVSAFNELYYRRVPATGRERAAHVESFLFPLDAIRDWNRLYGKRGFYQFQCVLPDAESYAGVRRLLEAVGRAGLGSPLVVLKTLGGPGRGHLSFALRGYTLAIDFPNRAATPALLALLTRLTLDHGGRVYLAKDACLSAAAFAAMYPRLDAFRAVLHEVDPTARLQSDLARRLNVRGDAQGGVHRRRA